MELVSRMMSSYRATMNSVETKPPAPAMPMDDDSEVWMQIPPWAFRWKRMMLQIQVVVVHSLSGAVIAYLETLRERLAQEALDEYKRKAGVTSLNGLAPRTATSRSTGPRPMAKGKLLKPSTVAKFPLHPACCPHRPEHMSHPEAGRTGQHGSHAYSVAVDGNVVGNHRTQILCRRR